MGRLQYPGEIGNNGYAKYWGLNKVRYNLFENGELPGSEAASNVPWNRLVIAYIFQIIMGRFPFNQNFRKFGISKGAEFPKCEPFNRKF